MLSKPAAMLCQDRAFGSTTLVWDKAQEFVGRAWGWRQGLCVTHACLSAQGFRCCLVERSGPTGGHESPRSLQRSAGVDGKSDGRQQRGNAKGRVEPHRKPSRSSALCGQRGGVQREQDDFTASNSQGRRGPPVPMPLHIITLSPSKLVLFISILFSPNDQKAGGG